MSERGVFAVDRGIWEHPSFAREPFTEREAWVWLIGSVAWKDTTVRAGKFVAAVKRGQGAFSIRFLADKWRWSKSRVDRFLDRLKNEDMIGTAIGTGITVVTINNYGSYQRVSLPDRDTNEQKSGTQAGQQRDKEEDIKDKKEDSVANATGADAPDPRRELFNRGLSTLASLTGKPPSSCRALVGRWLRDCNDEAIHVLAAIDEAAQDRPIDPVPWIAARLKPKLNSGNGHAKTAPNGLALALRSLDDSIERDARSQAGSETPPRLLSHG